MTTERPPVEIVAVRAFRGIRERGDAPLNPGDAEAIAASWTTRAASNPRLFDGRVLLSMSSGVEDGVLVARYRETSYSTFMWWRANGYPAGVRNTFGSAAVLTSDRALLLGRMAPHTSNAGLIYFPAGTPDLGDVVGDTVDLEASILRELEEETGLTTDIAHPTETRLAIFDGPMLACLRVFETTLDAAALKSRVEATLASDADPEFDAVVLVRSSRELTPETSPGYARAAVAHLLGE